MSELTKARKKLARRLEREFTPVTEHGDIIRLADFEANTLAEIIEEFIDAKIIEAGCHVRQK